MAQADYVTIPIRASVPDLDKRSTVRPCRRHAEFNANSARHRIHPLPPYLDPGDLKDRAPVFNDIGPPLLDANVIGTLPAADGIRRRVT
jgi:hypothetical protein